MTSVLDRVRGVLVRADDAMLAVRDSLTPGQRWTAALLAGVALAVLLAGAPTHTIVRPGEQAAVAATPVRTSTPRPGPSATVQAGAPDVPSLAPSSVAPLGPADVAPPTEEPPPPEDHPAPAPPDDDGEGGEGGPPPCPVDIPLVVAEAGLCTQG